MKECETPNSGVFFSREFSTWALQNISILDSNFKDFIVERYFKQKFRPPNNFIKSGLRISNYV